mmetsp:Transcript_16101/g.32626  ORF Transcript_16101/g.32626 Transcript_16101/m.32626 type:complete len:154 (-) Transcript_16101:111-572(-)
MVKIINGEIVPDDDPRAKAYARRMNAANTGSSRNTGNPSAAYGSGPGQSGQMFATQQSGAQEPGKGFMGLPTIKIMGEEIKPEMYLGAALLAFFFGPEKVLILIAVFFLFKWYQQKTRGQNAAPFPQGTQGPGNSRRPGRPSGRVTGIRTLHD